MIGHKIGSSLIYHPTCFNGRTDKLNGRTVYQRTHKIVLPYYIRFWYSTPQLPDENYSKKPGLLENNAYHTHITSFQCYNQVPFRVIFSREFNLASCTQEFLNSKTGHGAIFTKINSCYGSCTSERSVTGIICEYVIQHNAVITRCHRNRTARIYNTNNVKKMITAEVEEESAVGEQLVPGVMKNRYWSIW